MRKALIVGIDHYNHIGNLSGAVNDAHAVKNVLERNADGTLNFPTPQLLVGTGAGADVTRVELKESVRELFADDADIALFYFAGHGHIEDTGGYLCASDCQSGDDGLSLAELMSLANSSKAKNKVIILDSCHSGAAGTNVLAKDVAEISDGVTILTASTANQYAMETPGGGSGVFTDLFVDALSGAAANLVGAITPGSVYAHIDQSLGPWAQRPVFKTNVKTFVSLREATAPIELTELQQLTDIFPTPTTQFALDPSYEPHRSGVEEASVPPPDPAHNAVFAILQNYVKVNLVRPHRSPPHVARGNGITRLRVDCARPALLEARERRPHLMSANEDIQAVLASPELLEKLAAIEHERWAHWQQYMHDQCRRADDGSLTIPAELAQRWQTQISTPYGDLTEAEKDSDREQVRRFLPTIGASIDAAAVQR